MIRLLVALCRIPLLAIFALSAAYAAEPKLPPAPYKPLPVGTVLDYGSWQCEVVSNKGFGTECEGPGKEQASFFGKFVIYGEQDSDGYGGSLYNYICKNSVWTAENLRIDDKAKRAIRGLWPLSVGKKVAFSYGKRGDTLFALSSKKDEIEVTGTARLQVGGSSRNVFVITGKFHRCRDENSAVYVDTWWYDPASGIVVKTKRKWDDGRNMWYEFEYSLVKVTPPKPMMIAQAPSTATAAPVPARRTRALLSPSPVAEDTAAPVIEVAERIAASGKSVEITGRVRDASQISELTVDGRPIPLAADGAFRIRRVVPAGRSVLRLAALDEWGNEAVREVVVTRKASPRSPAVAALAKKKADPFADIYFGKYHALVIGNNRYPGFPDLKTAVPDARAVAETLRRDYGFEVDLRINAKRYDIISALAKMRARLTADDSLLVYYAGHGVIDDLTEQGYWLPVDAEQGNPSNWVSTADVTTMVRAIGAKHVMVVADSCYSGTLVRAVTSGIKTATERVAWVRRMMGKRSRTALVSGGLEPVMDSGGGGHSVFAKAFLDALENNRAVMEGQALFDAVKRPVVLNSDQTPQYSDIRKAGHDGGEFMFVRRGS